MTPIFKDYDAWHENHEVKMVYTTSMSLHSVKGPIVHTKRDSLVTAISGVVMLVTEVNGIKEEIMLRDRAGKSILAKIIAGVPAQYKCMSAEGIILCMPNIAWHEKTDDSVKFDNWEEYNLSK